jgi:hypothetical protein
VHGIFALDADELQSADERGRFDAIMRTAGDAFVGAFDEVNRLGARTDLQSIRTFDGEDLRRVLLAGRFVSFGQVEMDAGESLTREELVNAFATLTEGHGPFVSGHAADRSSFAALVVMAPRSMLAATPGRLFEEALAEIRERTGGSALYVGLYAHVSPRPRVLAIASGMPIPGQLHEFTSTARQEATQFCRKLGAPQQRLDVNPLKGLSLFGKGARTPMPAGR